MAGGGGGGGREGKSDRGFAIHLSSVGTSTSFRPDKQEEHLCMREYYCFVNIHGLVSSPYCTVHSRSLFDGSPTALIQVVVRILSSWNMAVFHIPLIHQLCWFSDSVMATS